MDRLNSMALTKLGLYEGIGGFSLAARELGICATHAVELGEFQRSVLRRHFPETELWDDIRTFEPAGRRWDIITGGSPCQDLSLAGNRSGIGGDRSSLFFEMLRIIEESRPTFVVWENVEGAVNSGLRSVLAGLRVCCYSWDTPQIISAAELGAPHLRKRVFVVAYPSELQQRFVGAESWADQVGQEVAAIAHASRERRQGKNSVQERSGTGGQVEVAANTSRAGQEGEARRGNPAERSGTTPEVRSSPEPKSTPMDDGVPGWLAEYSHAGWWRDNPAPRECGVPRGSYPGRYQQLEAIGNAVTPQQAAIALKRVVYLNSLLTV